MFGVEGALRRATGSKGRSRGKGYLVGWVMTKSPS